MSKLVIITTIGIIISVILGGLGLYVDKHIIPESSWVLSLSFYGPVLLGVIVPWLAGTVGNFSVTKKQLHGLMGSSAICTGIFMVVLFIGRWLIGLI